MGGSLLDNETRPGQSSAAQAQDAGLVRILCVAREGAYDTSHEPPTADPHGGWCGGWELKTPGYPIRHLRGPVHVLCASAQEARCCQMPLE